MKRKRSNEVGKDGREKEENEGGRLSKEEENEREDQEGGRSILSCVKASHLSMK